MSKQNPTKRWAALTWDDLDSWAGRRSVSRGQAYQQQGRVQELAIAADGRLLATVEGGDRYVVTVRQTGKRRGVEALESHCTCPVGFACKHAVATVAEYLEALGEEREVPLAAEDDPRWDELAERETESDEDFDVALDEEEWEEEAPPMPRRRQSRSDSADAKIRQYIEGKSYEELTELVYALTERYSELRTEFLERIALGAGNTKQLLTQARQEMRALTAEQGWRNSWTGEGYTPDYSRFQHRLERLVELGQADAVVELGREFIRLAMKQIEQSNDEGETAEAVAECSSVVFQAVEKSSLSGCDKLMFVIDAYLQEDYDVLGDEPAAILDSPWPTADWSTVADTLRARLKKMPAGSGHDFSDKYQRDRLSGWLLTALEKAGRGDELMAVYEAEARATGSYERLVEYLIEQSRVDDAQQWAKEGIAKTHEKWPGIASALAERLCEVAKRRRQWDIVAAHAAWRFFDHPSSSTFKELIDRAAKAKCADAVRELALRFLETGTAPVSVVAGKKEPSLRADPAWPLPVPDYLAPLLAKPASSRPHYDVLLDMAISAKRPDEVLHWYDKMQAGRKGAHGGWGWAGASDGQRVAAAVAKSHPERALKIYRDRLNSHLPHASMGSYEAAAAELKHMRPILETLGRHEEWKNLLAEIRAKYGNRPRFMEILDRLTDRTILETRKKRRR